ncbi:hypothetical protein FV227_27695 [Methylobacterium sp. WL119]|nr:hypothetical protein FV223_27555 [Methylobacterium sp. WL116]TXN20570.1 hypothetical protein FV225_27415 [Methylobacterium sp. WL93]TXN43665.1 hypothetical protein FV227_27695 [Methylobacterium sp. WL119]
MPERPSLPLSPHAGRGPQAPRRACGKRRRSRSGGEGARTDEAPSSRPPHRRLPPRRDDDEVVAALSPQAGRGDARGSRRDALPSTSRLAASGQGTRA